MLTPMVCWIIGAFYSRLKVRFVHIVAFILMAIVSFGLVSPLSASRDLAEDLDTPQRVQLVGYLLTHWTEFQEHAKEQDLQNPGGVRGYYNTPQGSLLERLSMIPPDDSLFAYTAQGHYEGFDPVVNYFENLAPHFISPNKRVLYNGNYYAHEMGYGLSADDFSTGISFSPVGEAYHCEGWGGILCLLPLLWIILFTSVDFIVGDMRKYPWGLMVVVWFAHAAPETLLTGIVYFIGYGNFGMLLAIITVTRIAPVLGALFIGKTSSPISRPMRRASSVLSQP